MNYQEFNLSGTTGENANDMLYRSWVSGPDGAHYELLREEHHTDEDIRKAKQYLHNNFDVVGIHIVKETELKDE